MARILIINKPKGLTLVEILVVLTIFAIIAVLLFTVFKSGLDSWRSMESNLELYQNASIAVDIITRDLTAAHINASNGAITFRGFDSSAKSGWMTASQADEVFFIAALNPGPGALFELCKAGYFLDSNNTLQRVYFAQTATPPDFAFSGSDYNNRSKAASNITQLNFRYWDSTIPGFIDTWDSRTGQAQAGRLPNMVEVTIDLREPNPVDPLNPKTQRFITNIYVPLGQR